MRFTRTWNYLQPAAAVLAACALISCGSSTKPVATETAAPSVYATPAEASQALQSAVKAGDKAAISKVLGAQSVDLLLAGDDAAATKAATDSFAAKYEQMNRWVPMKNGSQILYIGADNYAFPIPLAKDSAGKWKFDYAAGRQEITARDIGRNELLAIDAVSAIAGAEDKYFEKGHDGNPAHQYTQIIVSDPGKQDGLYWDAPATQEASPLGNLSDFVSSPLAPLGPGEPQVLDGYSLRILNAQGDKAKGGARSYVVNGKMTGGYAVIATPVTYRRTGIMTFIVAKDGVVYQQDLGANSAAAAAAIKDYNPGDGWTAAE